MIYPSVNELMAEIEHICKLIGISQKELAQKMHIAQQNVSHIFSNNNPSYMALLYLCDDLDVCMDIKFVDKKFTEKKDDII